MLRTLHVGCTGAGAAGGQRGRIPAVTSRPPSSPDIHLARPRARIPLAISAIIVTTIIYLRSEAKQFEFGGRWFSELLRTL